MEQEPLKTQNKSKSFHMSQYVEDEKKEEDKCEFKKGKEKERQSYLLDIKSFRIALISIFTALSVVVGYLLITLPNIELFTLMLFLSGFILNKKNGAIIGLMASFLFTFFNPFGSSITYAPLFVYQLLHYSFVGYLGGFIKELLKDKPYFEPRNDLYKTRIMIIFGILGGLITFIYDILTTLIGTITIYGSIKFFMLYYLSGIVFTTIHLVGNTLGFIFILPGLISLIYKWFE